MLTKKEILTMTRLALTTTDRKDNLRPGTIPLTNATSEAQVYSLWLHDKSETTQSSYKTGIKQFRKFTGKGWRETTIDDLNKYQKYLAAHYQSLHTRKNKIQIIKSLLTYAQKIGYLTIDIRQPIKTQPPPDSHNQKILRKEIDRLISTGTPRNKAIIGLLFDGGLKVSELVNLKWSDIHQVGDRFIMTIVATGNKQRSLLVTPQVLELLKNLPKTNDYVVTNTRGNAISRVDVHKILQHLANKASILKM
jgi:integrase/recombinase XerD